MNEQQQPGVSEAVDAGGLLPELGAAELEALSGYRAQEVMPAAAADRVLASLEATPPVSGLESWLGSRAARLLLGAVLVTAIPLALWVTLGDGDATPPRGAGAVAVSQPRSEREPVAIPEASESEGKQPAGIAAPVPEEDEPAKASEPAEQATPNIEDTAPRSTAPKPTRRSSGKSNSRVSAEEPARAASSLAAEAELLKQAQRAVARGDAEEALALVKRHAKDFERGLMVEERLVLEVVALCAAGRETRGRDKAERFLQRHPKSPSRKRVMEACPEFTAP